ncbi:MAG: hypothetical protein IKK66_01990 [Ruminococcus sp.]|nr:hypothetical protein [Ruminococcus sp.]
MNKYENAEGARIREMFAPKLQEGESIQWCGASAEKLTMKERGMSARHLIIPVFLVALCIVLAFIALVSAGNNGIILTAVFLLGVGALFYGAVFLLHRVLFGAQSLYVVTNQRLYILTQKGKIDVSLELTALSSIYATPGRNNTGTVSMRNSSVGKYSNMVYVNLMGIEYPTKVCDIITEAVDNAIIMEKKKSQANRY